MLEELKILHLQPPLPHSLPLPRSLTPPPRSRARSPHHHLQPPLPHSLPRSRSRTPPPSPALQLWSGESDLWSQSLHSLTALSQHSEHTFTLCFTLFIFNLGKYCFTFYFIALCYIICAKSFFLNTLPSMFTNNKEFVLVTEFSNTQRQQHT